MVKKYQRRNGQCAGPECTRPIHSRGLCETHYGQVRRGGKLKAITEYTQRTDETGKRKECSFEGCNLYVTSSGLCSGHYRQRSVGQPLAPLRPNSRTMARRDPNYQTPKCIGPDCDRPVKAKGMCFAHYKQINYLGRTELTPLRHRTRKADIPAHCTGPDCTRPVKHSRLCTAHLLQKYRNRPLTPLRAYKRHTDAQEWASGVRTNDSGSPHGSENAEGSK